MPVRGDSTKFGWRPLAALLFLALALGISACGGGSGDSSESDEEQVESAINTALTSTEPAACGDSRTIAFMEETGDSTGTTAERECEEAVADREGLPESVTIHKVRVDGEKATAEVALEGGAPDGMVMDVALVEEDGSWKIDEFTGLARLDRDRFTDKIERAFVKEGMGPPEIRCLVAELDRLPESEFEELALSADQESITKMTDRCEVQIEADREMARAEQKAEERAERRELAEIEAEAEAEALAEYPRGVQQSFLATCLAGSGSDFDACECSLDFLEANYSVQELRQAEANIASGRLREMVESAGSTCA